MNEMTERPRTVMRDTRKALEILDGANGRIVSAVFIKGDGTERKMKARAGVKKYLTGEGMKYDPIAKGLYPVFDMDKGQYRTINLKTLISVKVNKKTYYFGEDGTPYDNPEHAESHGIYGDYDPEAGF